MREQPFGSPGCLDGGTELRALRALIDNGATCGCSRGGDSWATAPTAAQEQEVRRPGAQYPPHIMAITDGAAQSADAQRVKATMQNLSEQMARIRIFAPKLS